MRHLNMLYVENQVFNASVFRAIHNERSFKSVEKMWFSVKVFFLQFKNSRLHFNPIIWFITRSIPLINYGFYILLHVNMQQKSNRNEFVSNCKYSWYGMFWIHIFVLECKILLWRCTYETFWRNTCTICLLALFSKRI